MDVARLNFSHGTQSEHLTRIKLIRKLSKEAGRPIAILQDLQGPKIRVGEFRNGPVVLKEGNKFTITTRQVKGNQEVASTSYLRHPLDLKRGDHILLNDGCIKLKVTDIKGREVHTRVIAGGALSNHKGINLPDVSISAPSITQKDLFDLAFGLKMGVDYVALSFVRTAQDVLKVKKIIKRAKADAHVIAKIEKHEAIQNLKEIISVADGVMVARGDLGVEMPLEDVPLLQKRIISLANRHFKIVITATQMLESIVKNPLPTRAEVSDVANAILDGTDAVMLSEETASGRYPVEAVRVMAKIAERAEEGLLKEHKFELEPIEKMPASEAVAQAACILADHLNARTIIPFTESGFTARMVSKFRSPVSALAITPTERVQRRMALYWGIKSEMVKEVKNIDQMIKTAVASARKKGFIKPGQIAIIIAGIPLGISGTTNLIKVHKL